MNNQVAVFSVGVSAYGRRAGNDFGRNLIGSLVGGDSRSSWAGAGEILQSPAGRQIGFCDRVVADHSSHLATIVVNGRADRDRAVECRRSARNGECKCVVTALGHLDDLQLALGLIVHRNL